MPSPLPSEPDPDASRLLALARPRPTERIAVLGPRALELTLELCRRGYEAVTCRPCAAPACAERSGAVLIGGAATHARLEALVGCAAACLGDEGVLTLELTDIDQDRVVEAALAAHGLRITSAVYNLAGPPVVVRHTVSRVAREEPAPLQAAA